MEILSENDLIRIAWTTTGFSTDSQRYAVKLLLRDGDLITLLTDYQHLYLDRVPLAKTFTAINAKLSAPDAVLLTKISELFASESAKSELSTSSDSVEHDSITISLENTSGKRNFKWKFEGRLISDHGQSFYVHVVRPMLDMLSLAADLHRLEFLKDNVKLKQPKDAFSKVQVRKLYEIVTSSLDYSAVASKLNDTTETTNSLPDTPPPESRKRPTESSDNNDDKDDQSESSLPPTPPPQETPAKSVRCEDDSEENNHETKNASGDIQMKSAEKSPAPKPKASNTATPKKRKLRF